MLLIGIPTMALEKTINNDSFCLTNLMNLLFYITKFMSLILFIIGFLDFGILIAI